MNHPNHFAYPPLASQPMIPARALRRAGVATLLVILLLLGPALITYGQEAGPVAEVEPNNNCPTAQDLGALSSATTVAGALDSTPSTPDVDFYRFTAAADSTLVIDLEGAPTGRGTLGDPFLGRFDASCQIVAASDDNGQTLNSRLFFTVSAGDVVGLGVTACCDTRFGGGGIGSYTLSVSQAQVIQSISGRIIDAHTGAPLSGAVSVSLHPCSNGQCGDILAVQATDANGRFQFELDQTGSPILAGTYRVVAAANNYQASDGVIVDVGAGQALDVGDLPLVPMAVAGSISGRLVDAVTGAPLRGTTRPFARVELRPCEPEGCYLGTVATASTDAQGRFRFTRDFYGGALIARDYQVAAFANQYDELAVAQFSVAEGQHLDLGDLRLRSHPLRFTEIRPCGNLPLEGGDCAYSVRVTNGLSTTLEAGIWSLVSMAEGPGGTPRPLFQAGSPVPVNLEPGASQVVRFAFEVPESAPDNQPICAEALGGRSPNVFFNLLGRADLFCITKGTTGFALLSDVEADAAQHPQADELVTTE